MHDIFDISFLDLPQPHSLFFTTYLLKILLEYKSKYLQRECPKDIVDRILCFNPIESFERMKNISISLSPDDRTMEHPCDRFHSMHQVFKTVEVQLPVSKDYPSFVFAEDIRKAVLFASKEIFVDMVSSTTMRDFCVHKIRLIINEKLKKGKLEIYYYSFRFEKLKFPSSFG